MPDPSVSQSGDSRHSSRCADPIEGLATAAETFADALGQVAELVELAL